MLSPVWLLPLLASGLGGRAEDDPVHVRLALPVDPAAPLEVTLAGELGAGRALRIASGVVGAYEPFPFGDFVGPVRAVPPSLVVERTGPAQWRIAGPDVPLERLEYTVDTAAAARAIDNVLCVTRRRADGALLLAGGLLLVLEGTEQRAHEVELALPAGWHVAWALARDERGRYRAPTAFELLDEPALLGPSVASVHVLGVAPERRAHVWREDQGDVERSLETLSQALRASARGLAQLGLPPHPGPYHVLFELFEPRPDRRLGWAMEHGRSFHAVDQSDRLDRLTPRLAYHVIHHELHAFLPRRLYTDRLAPWRQLFGEPTRCIWLAEGFAQYLAFCALVRSGASDLETALAYLAQRFAVPYRRAAPPAPIAPAELSLSIGAGDHAHWVWEFAAGALFALWLDADVRAASDGARGLIDVVRALTPGLPEAELAGALGAAARLDLSERFERHVDGAEPLPLARILAAVGIVADGEGYRVLPDADVSEGVRTLRLRSFGTRF